ncbi:MAG: fasciclin domain-containing protein [Cellulophaga sp.]
MKFQIIFLFLFCFSISFSQYSVTESGPNIGGILYSDINVLEKLNEEDSHKVMLAAIATTNLKYILEKEGPYTIFAPLDSAFKKLPKETWNSLLLPENRKNLQSLLSYHIISGKFSASKILQAMSYGNGIATFKTVQGDLITATMDGIDIILTDSFGNSARIKTADVAQPNGVLHSIDTVILPKKNVNF